MYDSNAGIEPPQCISACRG